MLTEDELGQVSGGEGLGEMVKDTLVKSSIDKLAIGLMFLIFAPTMNEIGKRIANFFFSESKKEKETDSKEAAPAA